MKARLRCFGIEPQGLVMSSLSTYKWLAIVSSNSDGISQMIPSDSILLLPRHTMTGARLCYIHSKSDHVRQEMERLHIF